MQTHIVGHTLEGADALAMRVNARSRMATHMLRGSLQSLRCLAQRSVRRQLAVAQAGAPGGRPSNTRTAAAAVEAPPEASTSTPGHGDAPAFRAYIDFKYVRDNLEGVAENCRNRLASAADPGKVVSLYEEYVGLQQETDRIRAARNENSSAMKVRGD